MSDVKFGDIVTAKDRLFRAKNRGTNRWVSHGEYFLGKEKPVTGIFIGKRRGVDCTQIEYDEYAGWEYGIKNPIVIGLIVPNGRENPVRVMFKDIVKVNEQ